MLLYISDKHRTLLFWTTIQYNISCFIHIKCIILFYLHMLCLVYIWYYVNQFILSGYGQETQLCKTSILVVIILYATSVSCQCVC